MIQIKNNTNIIRIPKGSLVEHCGDCAVDDQFCIVSITKLSNNKEYKIIGQVSNSVCSNVISVLFDLNTELKCGEYEVNIYLSANNKSYKYKNIANI